MPEQAPINSLTPYPGNPRRGNVDAIASSLEANGQYQPIIIRLDGTILAGNHTWEAAKRLGWPTVAVRRVDVDDDTAARIVLADNRTSDLASYDEGGLLELLDALPDLDGTGFSDLDVGKLRDIVEAPLDLSIPDPERAPADHAPVEGDGGEDAEVDEDLEPTPQIEVPRLEAPIRLTTEEGRMIVHTVTQRGGVAEDTLRVMLRLPPRQRASGKIARLGVTPPVHASSDVERVPIDSVEPHPSNPRQGDVGAVAASLAEFGQYRPLVVQRDTGHILAGSHRWMAMKSLNVTEVDVVFVDVDDEAAVRIMLADNRTSDVGRYDPQALLDMLQQVGTLEGTAYELDDVDELFAKVAADQTSRFARIIVSVPDERTRWIIQEPWRRYDRWFDKLVKAAGSADDEAVAREFLGRLAS